MATVNESTLASMDAAASKETTYSMSVGDTFNGILDQKFDEDWIEIELEKGKTYKINLSGRGKGGDEAEDTILKLFDSKGDHIVTNDDIDTANKIYDSELIFTATADDTYYISARSYTSNPNLDNSGAYMITVAEYELVIDTSIKGTNASNRLTGTNDAEKISGLGGNDTLYGRGGDDELDGGSGDDTLIGGAGADKLTGGTGNDTASYTGSSAAVTVRLHEPASRGGDAGGDTFEGTVSFTYTDKGKRVTKDLPDIIHLTGSDHNDVLAGDERANRLSGGRGNDTIYGGPGGDDKNSDTIYGGSGHDKLYGGRGDDKLYGSEGNDELRGGADDDTLSGSSGTDKLYGGDGEDILDGGSGDDILDGGDGEDIYRFSQNDGDDDIKGFSTSRRDGDRIDLTDFEDIDSMDDLDIKQRGSDTRIDLDGYDGGEIWLLDFDKDDLDDDDFIFYSDRDDHRDNNRDNDRDNDRDDDDDDDVPVTPITPGNPNDDIYYGTSGKNSKNSGAGDDVLYGLAGDDVLQGGPDIDSFEGGPGNDIIRVDSADIYVDTDDPKLTGAEARVSDEIDGGENPGRLGDSDTLSFEDWEEAAGATGVTVSLATVTVTHGTFGSKPNAFKNIENLIGSRYVDTLTGDDGANVIEGGADSDVLDGSDGSDDTVSYQGSNASVTVSLAQQDGTEQSGGHAAGDTLTGFENILGSRHADTLTGDGSNNVIEGGAGADTLDGGGGMNTLSYRSSSGAVTIDLAEGTQDFADTTDKTIKTSSGGHAAGDEVKFGTFQHIIGSRYGDRLTGNDGVDNILEGGPGADRLSGGSGDDTASYAGATAMVTVDLTESGRGRGDAAGDRFDSIEKYLGSTHDDTFIASANEEEIDGGDGSDTVSYERSAAEVSVDLSNPAQSDSTENSYADGDTLNNIENLIGSPFGDTLVGNNAANVIDGGRGDDTTLTGGGGDDVFKFASGDGADHITDFTDGDKIDLSAFTGIASLEDLEDDIDTTGGNTEIDLPGGGSVTLDGYTAALRDEDFIFYPRSSSRSTRGNDEANLLIGGTGNDTLRGRGGDDRLYGGAGDDTLRGDAGADTLHGGTGSDTFIITYEAVDNVLDSVFGEGDNEPGTPAGEDLTSDDTLSYAEWVKPAGDTTGDDGVTVTLAGSATDVSENTGIENLIGSRYEDILTGDNLDNVIEGGADSDVLDGSDGSDDTVSYQGSNASVTVSLAQQDGTEQSGGHAAGDTLTGFENILGSRHADTLTGDGSNNVIEGGAGADTLDGGGGMNTLSYRSSSGAVTIDLAEGTQDFADTTDKTIKTSSGGNAAGDEVKFGTFQHIIGSRYGDRLTGNDGVDNILEGGPGADRLSGGSGDDTASYAGATAKVTVDLTESGRGRGDATGDRFDSIEKFTGSAHDDTFIASADVEEIDGGEGTGTDDGVDTVSYERSKGVEVDLTDTNAQDASTDYDNADNFAKGDTLTDIENIIGSPFGDTLVGNNAANVIDGGRGDDTTLTGGGGDDVFKFASGDGADHITDFTDGDKIDLSAFTGIASLEDLEDDIDTTGGNTEIDLPGGGSVTLDGYTAALRDEDFIFHESVINGNSGSNTLKGDRRGNEIKAGAGDDRVFGNGGKDTLYGEAGDDEMYGGADDDTLNGGPGDDILDGGPGADTFVFTPGNGNDYVMDFQSGEDKIDLSMFDSPSTNDTISGDDNYTIELPDGGTITLLGVTTVDTGADFMF